MNNFCSKACFIGFALSLSCSKGYQPSPCLEEPAEDDTPPALNLSVEYMSNGMKQETALRENEPNRTIDAQPGSAITIRYSGTDREGMRSLYLKVVNIKEIMGKQQKHEYEVLPLTASCPRAELNDLFSIAQVKQPGYLQISLKGENWTGKRSSTGTIRIDIKQ